MHELDEVSGFLPWLTSDTLVEGPCNKLARHSADGRPRWPSEQTALEVAIGSAYNVQGKSGDRAEVFNIGINETRSENTRRRGMFHVLCHLVDQGVVLMAYVR